MTTTYLSSNLSIYMISKEDIGALIKRHRNEARLQQKEVAAQTHCTPGFITKIEKGLTTPSLELAFRLETVLGLTNWEISSLVVRQSYDRAGNEGKEAKDGLKIGLLNPLKTSTELPNTPAQKFSIPLVLDLSISVRSQA